MVKYVIKRVLVAAVNIVFIACITFILMNMVPGGPFLSEKAPSAAVLKSLEAKYGLDKPLGTQLINYLKYAAKGDFGVSFRMQKNRPVRDIIFEMFPVSAKVGIFSVLFAVACGVPMGCLAAYYKGKKLDSILRVVNTLGIAVPGFVLATLLLLFFCVFVGQLKEGHPLYWLRVLQLPGIGLSSWKHYLMPVFSLSFYPMCYIARQTRSSMLDVINQEYIRTAIAKGVKPSKLIFKHTLRNAIIPVITYIGPLTAYTLTGGFVVEKVFSIPGLGRYFVNSIINRDYPIIMGTTIFLAAMIVVMNLIVDIAYKIVDPRIQYGKVTE